MVFQKIIARETTGEQSWVEIVKQEEEELDRMLGDDAFAEPYKSYLDELRREIEQTYRVHGDHKQEQFFHHPSY